MTAAVLAARLDAVSRDFSSEAGMTVQAVQDVSLAIPAAAMTLLTGASGSGKTTLLSLMGGLLPATRGTVTVAGCELGRLSQAELTAFRLHNIGIIYQSFHLIDALNVVENAELPLAVSGMSRPESWHRALLLIEKLGLHDRRLFHPRALSGGEKQRVAIARALANAPTLILADEPTGSLDAKAGREVIELLHEQAALRGRGVVVASHDQRICRYADQIVHLEFGRVVSTTSGHPR